MLKVIIADDEITTRESLKEYVRWDAFGIDDVRTAKDGLDALRLAEQTSPDILITDVRMPKMDGIVLATRIRELYPDCRIIFISGYSDKEYLKSAIHLKAVSYIEKPIDLEEVESVVGRAVDAWREDERRRTDAEQLKSSVTQSRPYIRQEIVLDLIKGNTDKKALIRKFDDSFLTTTQAGSVAAGSVKLNWKPDVDVKQQSDLRHGILELFCDGELFDQSAIIAGITPEDNVALIFSNPAVKSLGSSDLPRTILERLNDLSKGYFSASIGIGPRVIGIADVAESYSLALSAQNMQFYSGSNRIYYYNSYDERRYIPKKNLFSDFQSLLKKDNMEGALELVRKLTQNVRRTADQQIDHIKNIYFNLLLLIFEAARDRNLIDPVDEAEKTYIWQEINNIQSLEECSEYIASNLSAVFSKFDNTDSVSRKIYEISKYIKENYSDKNLSIQMIADNVHFSQTYLCSFYKKSTGSTLNEYITQVRIEKAKELLQDGSIKLYEVAVSIGFTDPNYFSTLFKKIVGCSPSEYRGKYRL
ncbi:MAG: response regulator [Clostridiaceae bacterium]|jgi:two-component system response regulator YesN|nr:response regulator [Clostridiaceae bacterium]